MLSSYRQAFYSGYIMTLSKKNFGNINIFFLQKIFRK